METFAEKLTMLRKRAGFKQEDFAAEVGVSVDTVRRWEGDKQEPRLGELKMIAKTLGTSISKLVGDNIEDTTNVKQEKYTKTQTLRNTKKGVIVIQQGNTRLEIPATSQGYAIIRDKLKDVSLNQQFTSVDIE